jgi:hypothetical protein
MKLSYISTGSLLGSCLYHVIKTKPDNVHSASIKGPSVLKRDNMIFARPVMISNVYQSRIYQYLFCRNFALKRNKEMINCVLSSESNNEIAFEDRKEVEERKL